MRPHYSPAANHPDVPADALRSCRFSLAGPLGLLVVILIGVIAPGVLLLGLQCSCSNSALWPAAGWDWRCSPARSRPALRPRKVLHEEAEAERAEVMDILSRCVSAEVASELWESRDQIMSGESRIVTIVFTDIRSFTTLSETASSDQIVVWLNDYFSHVQAIVTRHGGHINKFPRRRSDDRFGAPVSRGGEIELAPRSPVV